VSSIDLPGEGYMVVAIETPPNNFDKIHAALAALTSDLATKPVSADELARAKKPLMETDTKQRETNAYWLGQLSTMMREPRVEQAIMDRPVKLAAVTAADVQQFIAKYVAGKTPIVVISKKGPAPSGPITVAPPPGPKKPGAERG
jgi:zinc protease